MEIVRDILAGRAIGIELHLTKRVGRTGNHKAALVRSYVVQIDPQTMLRIVHRHNDPVPRVHKEVFSWIGSESRQRGLYGIDWSLWHAILSDKGEVDRLDTRDIETGRIVGLPGQGV